MSLYLAVQKGRAKKTPPGTFPGQAEVRAWVWRNVCDDAVISVSDNETAYDYFGFAGTYVVQGLVQEANDEAAR